MLQGTVLLNKAQEVQSLEQGNIGLPSCRRLYSPLIQRRQTQQVRQAQLMRRPT